MHIKNTTSRYGSMAIILHWLMALLIVALLILGFIIAELPKGPLKLSLLDIHKEFGFLVLLLAVMRLAWRISNTSPSLASLPDWQRNAARAVHWSFYGFMFAQPLTGWLMTSAAGFPISFFGLFTIPTLIAPNNQLSDLFFEIHQWLAILLIAAILIHTAAALMHHYIDKDNILRRML